VADIQSNRENSAVLKATVSSVLALSLLAAAGCGKEQPAPAPAPAAPAASAESAQPHPMPTGAPAVDVDLSGIARADGGKTVAEVYAEKDGLADATVVVRGKVVKVNAGIMDRNWLHVRDGSGEEGTNDLTVTTLADLPGVGATVLVSGKLAVNKDFGMGYQYPVILEDAEVTVE
jgi:hypothetical protein